MSTKVDLSIIITNVPAPPGPGPIEVQGNIVPLPGSGSYGNPNKPNGLKFPKNNSFDINFFLEDRTGSGLEFPATTPSDAFWTGPLGQCPVAAPGNGSSDFKVKSVTASHLVVANRNQTSGEWMYNLRFRSTNSGQEGLWFCLDPVIQNGGGGHSMLVKSLAIVLLVVVVAAAFAFVLVR